MDIQGYIVDYWLGKTSAERPILVVCDPEGIYRELLDVARERGVEVVDATRDFLAARITAQKFWCEKAGREKSARLIVYRSCAVPGERERAQDPWGGFAATGSVFPMGPNDSFENMCLNFLPNKRAEIRAMFKAKGASFLKVNSLMEGANYPALEELTHGKSTVEMTLGLLGLDSCADMKWTQEWARFAGDQFPGLDGEGASLGEIQAKAWRYFLFSEFVFDLPAALPEKLRTVARAGEDLREKVYLVCEKIRNSHDMREAYVKMAKKVVEDLDLEALFPKATHLGERVTFRFENRVEFERFIEHLAKNETLAARDLYEKNLADVWCEVDKDVAQFWRLGKEALDLFETIGGGVSKSSQLQEVIEWYVKKGHVADGALRRFEGIYLQVTNPSDQVKHLRELFMKAYRSFAEEGVKTYQNLATHLRGMGEQDNCVCEAKVYPALEAGKRVAVFFVDALRYEMGEQFAASLRGAFEKGVTCEARGAYLPSVTRFGMARHLGAIKVRAVDGKLQPFIGEKKIETVQERIDYLKTRVEGGVQDLPLDAFDEKKIDEKTRLLVVRSNGIDAAGEQGKSSGVSAMETELASLARAVNDLRRTSFDLAVVCADHGFMLFADSKAGDKVNKPSGCDVVMEESRLLVGKFDHGEGALRLRPEDIRCEIEPGDCHFAYAKGFSTFVKGETYFHEGLSLQENVVPIVSIELKGERKRKYALGLNYKGGTMTTVHTMRPLLDVTVTADDLFAPAVQFKLVATDGKGKIIGRAEGKCVNELTGFVEVKPGCGVMRQPVAIDEEYVGCSLVFEAYDAETNVKLSSIELNYERN